MTTLKQTYWKARDFVFWKFIVRLQWFAFNKNKILKGNHHEKFSIGIVTYISRYDSFFKKLIVQLTRIFPDMEIIVIVNGYYDLEAQKNYLEKISAFLNQFPNVKYVSYHEPQGLSKLWNNIITNASHEHVFILNDDIIISPSLRKELIQMPKNTLTLINNSWSHFLIAKKTVQEIGTFDERFIEIGNEDQDYEFRLIAQNHRTETILINKIKSVVEQPLDFSYGKNMKTVNKKYSLANWNFLNKKWDISTEKKENYLYSSKFNIWFNPTPKL